MAEIYKQQVEHNASGGTMLKAAPFRNYFEQGVRDAEEGFKKLDQYMEYLGDKELAGKMDVAAQESADAIQNWQDFSMGWQDRALANIMSKYDEAFASAPYSAQKRINDANPEARKIFELKAKESILKKAKEHILSEKQRSFNSLAEEVALVRDPKNNEQALRAMLDHISQNEGDVLSIEETGALIDQAGHDAVSFTIGQAIVEGRDEDAEAYLKNPFYMRFLGPEENLNFQKQVKSLRKSKEEDRAAGGNYKDITSMLIAGRDAGMAIYGVTPEGRLAFEEDYSKFVRALKNGEPMTGLTMRGRPFSDFLTENGLKAAEYWDSLPMTTRQLAVQEYEKTIKGIFPEYAARQNYLANVFVSQLSPYTDEGGVVDLSNITNNELRELKADAFELDGLRSGLDSNVQKKLDGVLGVLQAKRYQAGKAISVDLSPIQQNIAGWPTNKMFLNGGNLTEAMIQRAQSNEEPISVIDEMLNNSANSVNGDAAQTLRSFQPALGTLGRVIGTGRLSTFMSDFADLLDDGSVRNAESVAFSAGRLMREMGEVDKKGNLVVPEANSYRFMSYVIPIVLSYVSVNANEQDLLNTGIKPGAINNVKTVDLVEALQNRYQDKLDVAIDDGSGKDIKDTEIYNMLMTAIDLAKKQGLANVGTEPNQNSMSGLANVLQDLAVKLPGAITAVPAKDSGDQKRLDAKTRAMFQFKE